MMTSPMVESCIVATAISLSYVLVLYISPQDRPNGTFLKNRDNPVILKRRMKKISIMTLVDIVIVCFFLQWRGATDDFVGSLNLMGILPGVSIDNNGGLQVDTIILQETFKLVVRDLVRFTLLFMGPLINEVVIERENWIYNAWQELGTLQGLRNYVIAPITEETVYTCCCLSVFHPLSRSSSKLVYFTPGLFAFAHLNHGWDLYLSGSYNNWQILVSLMFQVTYTWGFGILTNNIFIKSQNVYSCIVVHSFCNLMGFPTLIPSRAGIWKYVYWLLLCLGVYSFTKF